MGKLKDIFIDAGGDLRYSSNWYCLPHDKPRKLNVSNTH